VRLHRATWVVGISLEGQPSEQQLVVHDRQAVDVGASIHLRRVAMAPFRYEVRGRAVDDRAGASRGLPCQEAGNAEVRKSLLVPFSEVRTLLGFRSR